MVLSYCNFDEYRRKRALFIKVLTMCMIAMASAQTDFPSDTPSLVPTSAVSVSSDSPSIFPSAPTSSPTKTEAPSIFVSRAPSNLPSSFIISVRPSRTPSTSINPSAKTVTPARNATARPTIRPNATSSEPTSRPTGKITSPTSKPTARSIEPATASPSIRSANCTITQGFFNPVCVQYGYFGQYACFDYRLFSSYLASQGCIRPITVKFDSCSESILSRRLSSEAETVSHSGQEQLAFNIDGRRRGQFASVGKNVINAANPSFDGLNTRKNVHDHVHERVERGLATRGIGKRNKRLRRKKRGPKGKAKGGKGPKGKKDSSGKDNISKKLDFTATDCTQTCVRVDEFLCLRASSAYQTDDSVVPSQDSVIRISYSVADASGVSTGLEFGVRLTGSPACYSPKSKCSVAKADKNLSLDRRKRRKGKFY